MCFVLGNGVILADNMWDGNPDGSDNWTIDTALTRAVTSRYVFGASTDSNIEIVNGGSLTMTTTVGGRSIYFGPVGADGVGNTSGLTFTLTGNGSLSVPAAKSFASDVTTGADVTFNVRDTATLNVPGIVLGRYGNTFVDQTGGTIGFGTNAYVANFGNATLDLSGGKSTFESQVIISERGIARFNLSGTHELSSTGTFRMGGGYGPDCQSYVNQSDQSIAAFNTITFGRENQTYSTKCGYTLTGGTMSATTFQLSSQTVAARYSTGSFDVSGGTATVGTLKNITTNLSADGTLNIGSLTMDRNVFTQTGGTLKATTVTPSGTSVLNWNGGTVSITTYMGDFTNAGATIAPETFDTTTFAKTSDYGTMAVTGSFAQAAGTIRLDAEYDGTNLTFNDKITADSFDISGGDLFLNLENIELGTSIPTTTFFETTGTRTLDFARILTFNSDDKYAWSVMGGDFIVTAEGLPEPAAWVMLVVGFGIFFLRNFSVGIYPDRGVVRMRMAALSGRWSSRPPTTAQAVARIGNPRSDGEISG